MKLQSNSDAATREIGRTLGKKLTPGSTVCLFGDLGAGKTTMVKGIASAFGIEERDITSASFTIIAEYEGNVPFYHIDLYRITSDDIAELGLHEYPGSDGVAVIEWAERAREEVAENVISVRFVIGDDDKREIEIEGADMEQ